MKRRADELRSSRIPVNIRVRPGQTAELMAIAMALQQALRTTLEELAVLHGSKAGVWLDELERTLTVDASNVWSQGLQLDAEVRALSGGRELVKMLVDALRQQLSDRGQRRANAFVPPVKRS
jgi:hypothetical protein